ncbi:polysaccharide deacetylase WbmS family protein [Dethiosulfatarculus sandiegensis]|uniref:Polysaccharide deacetylase n=1 Tax=Dethiosulfatarculus sandiegensis TaxID=1429043 RepID=A0A0D2JPX5_9BACT|nr:hypothetical protein [Dethiosulfatarculus sandiegensis]KIX11500.1 hypothetical protein X474_23505 [Dethiosulfatarculus sandiegensis]
MISLTLDTDWVPDAVLSDTMDLLAEHNQRCTAFCTSDYPAVLLKGHEAALHPNYHNREISEAEHLKSLLELYPKAKGVRAHTLYIHGRLITATYPEAGLLYSSDYMMLYQKDIKPIPMLGLWQMPIFFADASWLRDLERNQAPKLNDFDLALPSLMVFCFHPIHIYVNTPDVAFYESIKKDYQNPARLRELRNRSRPGVRDLFMELLMRMDKMGLKSKPLLECLPDNQA